jgi:FkbM family methyltransferase
MDKACFKHVNDFIYDEMFKYNVYALTSTDVNNRAVLDLGGHYGVFAMFCKQLGAKQVLSVEANQYNLAKYVENTEGVKEIKVINAAVTSSFLSGEITTINNSGGESRVGTGEQLVTTISINKLVNQLDPHLEWVLKVDIEGSEYDVLYKTEPQFFKKFKVIALEAHNENGSKINEAEKLKTYIVNLGFSLEHTGFFWSETFDAEKHGFNLAYSYKFVNMS